MLTPSGQKCFELPAKYGDHVPVSITCDDLATELLYLRYSFLPSTVLIRRPEISGTKSIKPSAFLENEDIQKGRIFEE